MCPKAWSINSPCDAHRCYFYPCVFLVLLYVFRVMNCKQKKMLFPSGNVHSCSSGKEADLVVLAAWIQQLFCTGNAPEVPCREKKVNGERKRNSAMNPVQCSGSQQGSGLPCPGGDSVCQWQSTERIHVPFLMSRVVLCSCHGAAGGPWHKDCAHAVVIGFRSWRMGIWQAWFYRSQPSLHYPVSHLCISFAFTCLSVYSHDFKPRAIYVLGRLLRKALGLT